MTPATFTERVHSESDLNYDPDRYPGTSSYVWDKWFWTKLKELGTFASSVDAPGADTLQNARLRARLWSTYGGPCALTQQQQMRTTWNNLDAGVGTFSWRGYTGFTIDTPVSGTRRRGNGLRITASDLVCTVNTAIAVSWFDLFYPRTYEPSGERLEFKAPAGGGTLLYEVGPFEGPVRPRLFDITDPLGAVEITGATYAPVTGGFRLAFESTDNANRRYVALPDTGFAGLPSGDVTTASGTSVDNLRSRTQQADYLVIYYDPLQSAADTLAAWRRFHNGYRTKTVPISAIYDQFSGGRTDPTAIRNFLRAAYYNWNTQPTYVMMLGDASYDFKNQLGRAAAGQPGNPLPTYENNFEAGSLRQFTTDDWLFNVDSAVVVVPDFLGGRLPVPDANSAMAVVRDKLLRYERSAPMGGYRNRVMLIADDNLQGSRPDDLGWAHLQQTQQLDSLSLPSGIDRDYVYLHTYPTRANQTKPDVRDSIVAHLDHGGVLLMNYVGHGSPFKIADESVLIATDADALSNRDRLPLFVAASCDVGRFSDPANSSLGEHMMNSPAGGAIGVISATDLAYSSANSTLNKIIFQSLFGRLASGEMSGQAAAALALGKAGGTVNGQKYQLMGDAALRLNLPRYWVEVHLRDEAGADTTEIRQGRRMSYRGLVLDRPNGTLVPLDGVADVLVEDSKPLLQAPACPAPSKYLCSPAALPYYFYSAGPVFRGPATVQAGVFSGEFIVPLEARPGARGRIRAYLSGSTPSSVSTDAAGDLKLRVVTGTLPSGDTRGPSIVLSFPNGATRVRPDAILRVDLTDSSGILITGHTPQNGIIVTVDGNSTSRVDLTEGFRYNSGSYQSGSLSFQLPNLSEGFHTISISAADNLAAGLVAGQHRSQSTLEFEVVQSPQLRVLSSYLFPDPMSSRGNSRGGQFVVDTEGGAVDVQVRIYTVAGRLIRLLTAAGAEGQLQLPWDGFDAEGQELANGAYLYKVVVRSGGAGSSADQEQHSGAVGRFVIVNP